MPAGLEALPPPPTLPGPLPLAGQVLAVAFATITGATNASPIVVTTTAPHNLVSGLPVTISGVVGNTAANTTAVATVLTPTTFSIPVAGNGAYVSGGTVAVNVLAQSVVIADPTTPANQAGVTAGGALKVDASAATQPVSVGSLPAASALSDLLPNPTTTSIAALVGLYSPVPTQPTTPMTLTPHNGGSGALTDGTWYLQYTLLRPDGTETDPSPEQSVALAAGTANQYIGFLIVPPNSGITLAYLYAGQVAGGAKQRTGGTQNVAGGTITNNFISVPNSGIAPPAPSIPVWQRGQSLAGVGNPLLARPTYGNGVGLRSGVPTSRSATLSPRSTAKITPLVGAVDAGVKRRTVCIANTLDQQCYVEVDGTIVGTAFALLGLNVPSGCTCVVGSAGIITVVGTAPTISAGAVANLDLPLATLAVTATPAIAPTQNTLAVEYLGLT